MLKIPVLIKGAGEMATGVAHRLFKAGFNVGMVELPQPLAVRRMVAFAQAVYAGEHLVEGVRAFKAAQNRPGSMGIPVYTAQAAEVLAHIKPAVFVEATLSKKNTGLHMDMASIVIALGPGYKAGRDVHAVVETKRGHNLGRVYYQGEALEDTGCPGDIGGFTSERVLRAPCCGTFVSPKQIGTVVAKGEIIGRVGQMELVAPLPGVIRGLLYSGLHVKAAMKLGDIDPRGQKQYCFTISDKARAIGGGVLEAVLYLSRVRRDLS